MVPLKIRILVIVIVFEISIAQSDVDWTWVMLHDGSKKQLYGRLKINIIEAEKKVMESRLKQTQWSRTEGRNEAKKLKLNQKDESEKQKLLFRICNSFW